MHKPCLGIPTDPARVLWHDGTGMAACGARQEHRPHLFTERVEDLGAYVAPALAPFVRRALAGELPPKAY
jgi:hypothetical protein